MMRLLRILGYSCSMVLMCMLLPAFGASAAFNASGSIAVGTTITEIGRLATSFSSGDTALLAIIQLDSGAGMMNVSAGDLALRRGGTVLATNAFTLHTSGLVAGKERVTVMLAANDTNAPANAIYNITAIADLLGGAAATQLLALHEAQTFYRNSSIVAVGTESTRILNFTPVVAGGEAVIIAAVHLENTAAATRTIAAGRLNITRNGQVIANTTLPVTLESTAGTLTSMTIFLIGNESSVPPTPEYNVTAEADGSGVNAQVQLLVVRNLASRSLPQSIVPVGASETELSLLPVSFPAGSNIVVASGEFQNTAGAVRTIGAGDFRLKNSTTINRSSDFGIPLGASGSGFPFRTHALLWLDAPASAQRTYNVSALADATGIDAAVGITVLRLTVGLAANSSSVVPAAVVTGETAVINGSCEALDGNASSVVLFLQNSTDNSSFTTISTNSAGSIFANVTSYSLGNLVGNSTRFTFLVNATIARTYSLRTQCTSTDAVPDANSSSHNITAAQAYGWLSVVLLQPVPDLIANVPQNNTILLLANVSCVSPNPTAMCDAVNGTARFNNSVGAPNQQIGTLASDTPLWADAGNKTCNVMVVGGRCSLNWTLNASGAIGSRHAIDVLFQSNASQVLANDTREGNLSITACGVSMSLQWSALRFGDVIPDTDANPAPGNSMNQYNITINSGSCATDLYIKGSNLTNQTMGTAIGVRNITWSNQSNTYSQSVPLSGIYTLIQENVAPVINITTWYWINMPPILAGVYNGTLSIAGVIHGDPAP